MHGKGRMIRVQCLQERFCWKGRIRERWAVCCSIYLGVWLILWVQVRRKKLLLYVGIPVTLLLLFGLLLLGAYTMSQGRKGRRSPPELRSNGTSNFAPTTILISLDGFRADFLDRDLTPTLNSFIEDGVSPKYMLPSFPSVTFPNHWTMVTGLYPESHGVVGNTFWDPDLQEEFYYTDPARSMQPKWWTSTGAEPLWSTCEQQGVRSAIHMWPGSEAHLELEPTILDKYNGTEVLSRKVDRVLEFLDRPSEHDSAAVALSEARPGFIAMYVPNVDQDGHKYGPNSTEIRTTISNVDSMLESLFEGLQQRNLTSIVNVIVVSDHGMATTSNDRLIQLEDMMDVSTIEHIDGWPLYGLRPNPTVDLQRLHDHLLSESYMRRHFSVHLRTSMPARWHFSRSDRIAPLWLVPEAGWAIVHRADFAVEAARANGTVYHPRGLHGYDHEHPLMRAIFVARGPAFPHAPGSRVDVFQNTEVYNIVCDSLGVKPRPNNGTLRLPLQPVGLHSDGPKEDLPNDLPASSGGTSMAPTVSASPAAVASAAPDAESGDADDEGHEADVSTDDDEDESPGGWWDFLADKFEEAKQWLSDLFGSNDGDDAEKRRFSG